MSSVDLRNPFVPCHYLYNFPVDFKKAQCRMSNLRNSYVSIIFSNVDRPHGACLF